MVEYTELKELKGEVIVHVEVNNSKDEILFCLQNGKSYKMYHPQDCCENVYIEDIEGDLTDLIGSPLVVAEEATKNTTEDGENEWGMWTFYRLGTERAFSVIRWVGYSEYYSVCVYLEEVV